MTSLCPRCLKDDETNAHVYCCSNLNAVKQWKADWLEQWHMTTFLINFKSNTGAEHYRLGKLLMDFGSIYWKVLQDLIDCNIPNRPKRAASDGMKLAMYQFIKCSMQCWKM